MYIKPTIYKKTILSISTLTNIIKVHNHIYQGTEKFFNVIKALFFAGTATFSMLYCVQPILPIFSEQFNLTPAQSSVALSSSTAMMAIGMLFTGFLSDFIGRKIIMSSSLLISSLLTILCYFVNNWESFILIRALIGLSLSGVIAIAMTYLSEEIHPNILAFSMGLYISGNTIGGFLGRILTSMLVSYFSWKVTLMMIGSLSFIFSLCFIYFLPVSRNFTSISLHPIELFNNFKKQWKDPTLIKLFTIGFFLMGSFITLFNYIGYRLMIKPFFLNQGIIGCLSAIYLIGVYTSPKAGILTKRYNRGTVLIGSLLLMIIGLMITQWDLLLLIILGLILFSGGFFAAHSVSSSWIGYQSKIAKGQASSLYLFFYYLGSSIFGTCGGFFWLLSEWKGISVFIISMLLIGLILSIKLRKNHNYFYNIHNY